MHRNLSLHGAALPLTLAALLLACFVSAAHSGEADTQAALERFRKQLNAVNLKVVRDYIAQQKTDTDRAFASLVVGGLYESGKLGDPDPVRAAEFYEDSAELGSPEAYFALGNIYNHGAQTATGEIRRDPAKARSYFEKAAEKGVPMAMLELGKIYADGMNTDPDPKKALPYFIDAAKRGEHEAIDRLETVMRKAREWEEAHPGKKANFPTSTEELVDYKLVKERMELDVNMQKESGRIFVEISRKISEATKNLN